MACNCPPGWCYRRNGCRRKRPAQLVPDFAAAEMREMRKTGRGMHSVDWRERQPLADGLPASAPQLAWLYERQHAIEAKLLKELPRRKRRNWEAARDFVNAAIERRSENTRVLHLVVAGGTPTVGAK